MIYIYTLDRREGAVKQPFFGLRKVTRDIEKKQEEKETIPAPPERGIVEES